MNIVAYYTPGPYEADAELFVASCRAVGVEPVVEAVPDLGNWNRNTAQKADFIARKREEIRGPLVYVDVDAFLHSDPSAFFTDLGRHRFDFGAHWFRGPSKGYDRRKVRDEGWWMLSGTLYFGDTPGARELIGHWQALNAFWAGRGYGGGGGQKNLWQCVTRMEPDSLKVSRIPGRYCYVFDKAWAYPNDEPVVIEHTIASRENRGGVRHNEARRHRIRDMRRQVGIR